MLYPAVEVHKIFRSQFRYSATKTEQINTKQKVKTS